MRCLSFFINTKHLGKKLCVGMCLKCLTVATPLSTTRSQNILHGDTLYNIKRKKYKTVCAEMVLAKVIFHRLFMLFL